MNIEWSDSIPIGQLGPAAEQCVGISPSATVARTIGYPDFVVAERGNKFLLYEALSHGYLARNEYLEFDSIDAAKAAVELLVSTYDH